MNKEYMWEVLVPTIHYESNNPIKTKFHRIWDAKVRKITGGLTIMPVAKGQWISPVGRLFVERMFPARIMCNDNKIQEILKMTKEHYNQEAVMYYKISDVVKIYR